MLTEIVIERVKSFMDRTVVPLAPLTVLTGVNSSGKSTIFQALLLLKQAFRLPLLSSAGMQLNGPLVAIGSYEDWASKHQRTSFTIGVTMRPPTQLPGSRHRFGAVAATRSRGLFWRYGARLVGGQPGSKVEGRFEVEFRAAADTPSVAVLETLKWNSKVHRDSIALAECSLEIERPVGESPIAVRTPTLPNDVDQDQFQFVMKERVTEQQIVAGPRSDQTIGAISPMRCSVEGLMPAWVLEGTKRPQWSMTLATAISRAIRYAGTELEATTVRVPGRRGRFGAKARVIAPWSTGRMLERDLAFIERCSDSEFIDCLQSSSDGMVHMFLSEFHWGDDHLKASEKMRANGEQVSREFVKRLSRTLDGLRVFDDHEECGGDGGSRDPGITRFPEFQSHGWGYVPLIEKVAARMTDRDARQELLALVSRAAAERRDNQFAMARRPAGRRRTGSSVRPSPPDAIAAPTEDLVEEQFVDYLHHIGPLREEPRNLYASDPPGFPYDVGRKGERAISCLRMYGQHTKVLVPDPEAQGLAPREMTLLDAVVAWGRRLGVFDALSIDSGQTKYGTVVNIVGQMDGDEIHPDLTNVGVGVSQLLPVLVLCLAAPPESTILIEQPELHLHPSVQTKLGEFLALCTLAGKQIVVETHSEHLINMLRLMVARKTLNPEEHLALLFSERDSYGTSITRIAVQNDGGLDRWPNGFFDEAEKTLSEIMNARMSGV